MSFKCLCSSVPHQKLYRRCQKYKVVIMKPIEMIVLSLIGLLFSAKEVILLLSSES